MLSKERQQTGTGPVGTASFRTTRGYTYAAVLCDEIAFWPTDDAAEPDYAILDAIRPGMATIPTSMLICASSPYARRGALYEAHKRHYGKDDAPLVWQAPTRAMNPNVPQELIDEALEKDRPAANAEYMARFRDDIETLLKRETVDEAVVPNVRERGPVRGANYFAFVDPSGGSADSMTLAIAHRERGKAILDLAVEVRPPFSPDKVVKDFARVLKGYGLSSVTGDRYGGEWPRERFRAHGIRYDPAEMTRSELYVALLPMMNSGTVELLCNDVLVEQLVALERRTGRSGRDIIDHPPGSHDDLANAAAGSLVLCSERRSGYSLEEMRLAFS